MKETRLLCPTPPRDPNRASPPIFQ